MLAALMLIGAASPHAQTIRGIGARPCSEWVQARAGGGRDFWAEQWVLGYLSGMNAAATDRAPSLFANAGDKAVFGAIDAYCRAHGQEVLWNAVKAFVSQRRAS
jgi:hypothetical protein